MRYRILIASLLLYGVCVAIGDQPLLAQNEKAQSATVPNLTGSWLQDEGPNKQYGTSATVTITQNGKELRWTFRENINFVATVSGTSIPFKWTYPDGRWGEGTLTYDAKAQTMIGDDTGHWGPARTSIRFG